MGDIQHFNSVRSLVDGRSTALQQCTVPSWWTDTAAGAAGWPGVGAERVLVDSGDGKGRPPACSRPVHLSIGPQPGWGRPDRPPPPPPLQTPAWIPQQKSKQEPTLGDYVSALSPPIPPFSFFTALSPFFPPPSHRHLCFQSSATGSPSSAQLAGVGRTAAVFAHLNWLHHRHLQFDENYIQSARHTILGSSTKQIGVRLSHCQWWHEFSLTSLRHNRKSDEVKPLRSQFHDQRC